MKFFKLKIKGLSSPLYSRSSFLLDDLNSINKTNVSNSTGNFSFVDQVKLTQKEKAIFKIYFPMHIIKR